MLLVSCFPSKIEEPMAQIYAAEMSTPNPINTWKPNSTYALPL
jgi:hypothetical protein